MSSYNHAIGRAEQINIGRVINSGRYGTVYHATGLRHGVTKEYAVKILPMKRHDMLSDQNMYMMRNEVINMWRCRGHRNVVYLYDVYKDQDNYYLVEEYCGGDTLQSKLGHVHTEKMALQIVMDIANALNHIHDKNIVFLDVKPQNIIYSSNDSTFKVTDFGSSRRCTNGHVHHSDVTCTPLFASPEVFLQYGEISSMHDAWSLGIILFWLLTGRHPFMEFDSGINNNKVIDAITNARPPLHEVPCGVRPVVSGLLEKDPARRLPIKDVLYLLS